MTERANSGDTEDPGSSGLPATSELKAMLAELLEGAKKDILSNVQESIDLIYADFEYVESETEGAQALGNPEANADTAPPKSTILYSQNPQILKKGLVAIRLNHLPRSSVLQRKQFQLLTRIWQKL